MLKEYSEEPMYLYFICSGSIGVYEKKLPLPNEEQIKETIRLMNLSADAAALKYAQQMLHLKHFQENGKDVLINNYHVGECVGDPELNFRTPIHTRLVCTKKETKVVMLSVESFFAVF